MTKYSKLMRCYVVGIPRIATLNGQGNLRISTVIAPDPETAVRSYLRREAPEFADTIIQYLNQRNMRSSIGEFAIPAPSHDIPRAPCDPQILEEQNTKIAHDLAQICDRDPGEVYSRVNSLLSLTA